MGTATIELVGVSVGKPQTITYQNQELQSAIFKQSVTGPVFLSKLGFEGDQVADTVHHGGVDKAVNVYSHEHYEFWERELGITLPPQSAFGENLTVRGVLEKDVCIGDIYQVGEAVVQVSQGRIPCGKISAKLGVDGMRNKFMETKFTGFYLRVLQEGIVGEDRTMKLLEKHPAGVTVEYLNHLAYEDEENVEDVRRVLNALGDTLAESWRKMLGRRLTTETETNE